MWDVLRMRVGADTGGTFTDFVTGTGEIVKVPSDPEAPQRALRAGLVELMGGEPAVLAHGTTVATNALLERRGGRVALIVNRGFADEIEIARQARPSLYDQHVDRPEPLVARADRYEVGGRLDGTGREIEALDPASIPTPHRRTLSDTKATMASMASILYRTFLKTTYPSTSVRPAVLMSTATVAICRTASRAALSTTPRHHQRLPR